MGRREKCLETENIVNLSTIGAETLCMGKQQLSKKVTDKIMF